MCADRGGNEGLALPFTMWVRQRSESWRMLCGRRRMWGSHTYLATFSRLVSYHILGFLGAWMIVPRLCYGEPEKRPLMYV